MPAGEATLACESKKYFSGIKRLYINSAMCYGYSDVWRRNQRHSMSQPSISSLEIVERAYESKNCVGFINR